MTLKPDPDPETQTVGERLANPTGPMCGLTPQPATGPVMGGAIPAAVNWRVYTALPPASTREVDRAVDLLACLTHKPTPLTMDRRAELLALVRDMAIKLADLEVNDDAKAFIRSALALVLE